MNHMRKNLQALFCKCQRGVAMVEFVLIFPFLLAMIFAVIEFSMLFATMLSINYATSEAAREVSVFDPRITTQDYAVRANDAMRRALPPVIAGLEGRLQFQVTEIDGCGSVADAVCLQLRITYPNYAANPIVPGVFSGLLPGGQNLLPAQLESTTTARLPVRLAP